MEQRSHTLLRAALDAVLAVAGSAAIGVVIVVGGLRWLDDLSDDGPATEAAYVAVAVAAVAVCGFGAAVGLRVLVAGIRDLRRASGGRRAAAR